MDNYGHVLFLNLKMTKNSYWKEVRFGLDL